MPKLKNQIRFLLAVFALLLLMTGCHRGEKKQDTPTSNYLQISFHTDVRSLDPRVGIDYPSAFITKMLFEGLMRFNQNGHVECAIAQDYTISDDQMTYTFHLRPSTWSNGDEVTAYDFEYTWKKIVDPKAGYSLGVQNFYPILNARAIVKGRKSIDTLGVKALNDKILQVQLGQPTPYFLEATATSSYYPVNHRIDQENPNWPNQAQQAFVCNGPFALHHRKVEDEIVVHKNETYWEAQQVQLPGIKIAIIKDATTQLSLFEKNQLEWLGKPISRIPLDAINHLRDKGKICFFQTLGVYWYFINTEAFPFNNKKMRQAFAYALNRKEIIDHILQGEEVPAMGVLPFRLSTQELPYFKDNDWERALQLFHEALDEIGITKNQLPRITINYNAAAAHERLAESLQEQWSQIFGLDIRLEQQEWKFHYDKLQKGNFQIGGMQWQSWLRDPIYIMQTFREKMNGVNMSRWENEDYIHYLDLAEKESDPVRRKHFFNKAETVLMEDMPVIPIYFTTIAFAKSPRLKNVYVSDTYEVDFRWATLETKE